jgi:hypothetical protein
LLFPGESSPPFLQEITRIAVVNRITVESFLIRIAGFSNVGLI